MRSLSVYPENLAEGADLHLDARGDLAVVSGAEDVRQRCAERLRYFLGEWHQAVREGIPWLEEVLIRPGDFGLTANILTRAVETLEGVSEVVALDLRLDDDSRTLIVTAYPRAEDGTVLDVTLTL